MNGPTPRAGSPPPHPRHRSVLPHCLAVIYGLAIAYASLQPFSPWIAPPPGTPFFLFAPGRYLRSDVLINVAAYLPLGFFLALVPRVRHPWGRFTFALTVGALLSFAMETLQTFLPPREATLLDLVSNATGAALGGSLGVIVARSDAAKQVISTARHRLFLGGKVGDIGLALLAVWLVVQVNPGIPLFATMFDPAVELNGFPGVREAGVEPDIATMPIEVAHSAFQLLGVGLFLALLLRERRFVPGAVLLLLATAVGVKSIAAAVLLKPIAFENWLRPGASIGVGVGALLLLLAMWLPRPPQVALATIALLSSLLATLFTPDLMFMRAPLALFSWSYGQLLNFNGLTHAVLLVWPLVASGFLFALAGRPRWGAPH